MKFRTVLLLSVCTSACAELPPVTGNGGAVSVSPQGVAPKTPVPTASYEIMKRLEQLQAEVQQLTGKVEEQGFHIEELKKQQKTTYTDFDDRLQALENKPDSSQVIPSASSDTANPESPDAGIAEPPAPNIGDQVTPESKPEAPIPDASVPDPGVPAAASSVPSDTGTQISDVEKQEYQQAYDDLRSGKTAQAITEFNAYLSSHPTSGYASNAQYWLGEAHRVNLDNTAARQAFNAVVDNHPGSAKVPDALYKLGIIEMEEKNTAKAREIFTRITGEFANGKAAALAQKKLQTLDTSAP
jgi:tol-pal system protein YbgF